MNKPQPKREITIVFNLSGYMLIRAASDDAQQWLCNNLPEFGKLVGSDVLWSFYVFPEYDGAEVAAYIESYNDEEPPC